MSTKVGRLLGNTPSFDVTLDTSLLVLGHNYRVCTDLDGDIGPLQVGDSGLSVHVSAMRVQNASDRVQVSNTYGQEIKLICSEGCSLSTRVTILAASVTNCTSATGSEPTAALQADGFVAGAGAFGGFGTSAWKVQLDLSGLAVGAYRLCGDLDGYGWKFTAGDVGIGVDVVDANR
jgi:hypothetical protein